MPAVVFLARKRFWLAVLKTAALVYVGALVLLQVPELRYDLGPQRPVAIAGPAALDTARFARATFASVSGTPDFEKAFVYGRHGVYFTYFLLHEYGPRLVIRSYERPTDESRQLNTFVGRLRGFQRQPFARRVRQAYADEFGVDIPPDALVLSVDDVPRVSGWQAGAVTFMGTIWGLMFYLFVVRPIRKRVGRSPS